MTVLSLLYFVAIVVFIPNINTKYKYKNIYKIVFTQHERVLGSSDDPLVGVSVYRFLYICVHFSSNLLRFRINCLNMSAAPFCFWTSP